MLSGYLERGSSPVDWCERNYLHSTVIAEFGNTVSNVVFLVLPPLMAALFRPYARQVHAGIHLLWGLFVVVGLSSAYFHATLSFLGQLLDELAILWLFTAAACMFYPRRFFPGFVHDDRRKLAVMMIVVAVVTSGLSIVKPAINAVALMILGVCVILLLVVELRGVQGRVYRLGVRSVATWLLAVACWLADYALCDALRALDLTFLHALFHLVVCVAAYTIIVMFSYQYAEAERGDLRPGISYWPRDCCELGLPYVAMRSDKDR